MKIMVDECCPPYVVEGLRQDGHDVLYVASDFPGLADADILGHALEEARVVVTEDRDFCELVFRDNKPTYGIVLMRIHHSKRSEKARRARYLFAEYADKLPHAMTTLTLNNIRIRPLG
jgi:predicted nuclease of predicted toxin-antitoxin system